MALKGIELTNVKQATELQLTTLRAANEKLQAKLKRLQQGVEVERKGIEVCIWCMSGMCHDGMYGCTCV